MAVPKLTDHGTREQNEPTFRAGPGLVAIVLLKGPGPERRTVPQGQAPC